MKAQKEVNDAILSLFSYDEIREYVKEQASRRGSESLRDLFEIRPKNTNEFVGILVGVFSSVWERQSKKIFNRAGNRVENIEVPNYDAQVQSLVRGNLEYVQNIAEAQREKMLEVLENGVREGTPTEEIADRAVEEVEGLTKVRAERIARTEITRASNDAMIGTMRHNGIDEYIWVAAMDGRTCPICRGYHRTKHPVGQGPLPVKDSHPNCRCSVVVG